MCQTTATETDRRIQAHCTVGDLRPGARYRTPAPPGGEGDTVMVTDHGGPGTVNIVNLRTGVITMALTSTKLGYDRLGRLYASRRLNAGPTTVPAEQVGEVFGGPDHEIAGPPDEPLPF